VLVQEIAESKDEIKDKVNVPKLVTKKVKSSFSDNPTKWFIGSAIGGLIVSKFVLGTVGFIFRSPKKTVSRGILYSLTSMAMRPMIKTFLIGKVKDVLMQRFLSQQPQQAKDVAYQDGYNSDNRY